jgi:hypothetical protein
MQTHVIPDLIVQPPYICHKLDILDVEREKYWRWQEIFLGGGKSNGLVVEGVTSWRWKEISLGGGKRDGLELARAMSWRWKERCLGGGKGDFKRYHL